MHGIDSLYKRLSHIKRAVPLTSRVYHYTQTDVESMGRERTTAKTCQHRHGLCRVQFYALPRALKAWTVRFGGLCTPLTLPRAFEESTVRFGGLCTPVTGLISSQEFKPVFGRARTAIGTVVIRSLNRHHSASTRRGHNTQKRITTDNSAAIDNTDCLDVLTLTRSRTRTEGFAAIRFAPDGLGRACKNDLQRRLCPTQASILPNPTNTQRLRIEKSSVYSASAPNNTR